MLLNEEHRALVLDPLVAGAIGGTIHHLTIQYPEQRSLFIAIYGLCLANAIFLVSNVQEVGWTSVNTLDLVGKWAIFNTIYVLLMSSNVSDLFSRSLLPLFSKLSIMRTFDIGGFLDSSGPEPRTGDILSITGIWKHRLNILQSFTENLV
jgi:hypothetical protein